MRRFSHTIICSARLFGLDKYTPYCCKEKSYEWNYFKSCLENTSTSIYNCRQQGHLSILTVSEQHPWKTCVIDNHSTSPTENLTLAWLLMKYDPKQLQIR